ncbi:MAG: hypothetical protein AAF266_03370, partial [Planctomycetota bacterium]
MTCSFAWRALAALLLSFACVANSAFAAPTDRAEASSAEEASDEEKTDEAEEEGSEDAEPVTSTGTVEIDGTSVPYVATTGKLLLKDDTLDEKAEVFFVAYTKGELDGEDEAIVDPARPITFCFNGGPGSASVWLHLGMLGPKRVKLPDDASFPPPPYQVVENPYSLLDITDLVFIDPVSTDYSRPAEGEKKEQFHG